MEKDSVVSRVTPNMEFATIAVKYRLVDGYHVFTSSDVKGLYVASKNSKKAFDAVSEVLEELIYRKTKKRGHVVAAVPYDDWLKRTTHRGRRRSQVIGRDFVLQIAA